MEEPQIYDIIIIGAGAAGITAAIYSVRKNLKVLVLSKDIGGQTELSGNVENYPGFTMITGADLTKRFREELMNFENQGLWVKEGVEVVDLTGADPDFLVKTREGSEYYGKTVIIASGRVPKMLNIPGEKELFGKGVTTCRALDTPFYKDKDVVIVGGGNSALDAAYTLDKVARSITIVNITDALKGDEVLLRKVNASPKVKVLNNTEALEILGEKAVGGIKIKDKTTFEEKVIPASGVFVEIGWTPSTGFDKLTDKNDNGEIEVDVYGTTSIPGIYAAGDVNDQWGEQIVIAAGEGAKTALRVSEHLSKVPHSKTSNIHEG